MMTEDEEARLRAAIRTALEFGNWESDIGFMIAEEVGEGENKTPIPGPFEVFVTDEVVAHVIVPSAWEQVPYIRECLQAMASQEMRAHRNASGSTSSLPN